ncbi:MULTISPECIES: sugar nucleotide-binding protein [unclassified Streptomyces]|uniref:SDR family oxidoreductase n=1 Tax=unclassified Streptomyces TaxID=2593676 RepID=UPI0022579B7C|nr:MULTISPECIES: sugar nucleotide-binding protein [unclassified Streptomyces]MCX4404987.1 sugar nucleotide-binding protein [Streptomyces sp. NBC_01764]MCX5190469.1 sugar nucleotide-binding protein [Streptomyces sp. NBC_00268]
MTVLIIGGSGFLGTELVRQATVAGHETAATFASRPGRASGVVWHQLDVRDPARVARVIADVAPSVVVNASSGNSDWAVTADGAVRVALAAVEQGCRLVHVSSDAVFSGARIRYDETCLPDPVTPYGAAKAAAETAVRLLAPDAAVARTSLIIGHGRSGHERMVRALAAGTRNGVLFTDDIRCPVHVEDLAAALWEVVLSDVAGVFHLAGPDALSRHDLGVLIARREGLGGVRLPAGRRADFCLPGALDVRLDSRATRQRLRTRLRGAREFLGGDGCADSGAAAANH